MNVAVLFHLELSWKFHRNFDDFCSLSVQDLCHVRVRVNLLYLQFFTNNHNARHYCCHGQMRGVNTKYKGRGGKGEGKRGGQGEKLGQEEVAQQALQRGWLGQWVMVGLGFHLAHHSTLSWCVMWHKVQERGKASGGSSCGSQLGLGESHQPMACKQLFLLFFHWFAIFWPFF
jgi:hypothetical protein